MTPRWPRLSPVLFHKELKGDQKVVVKVSQQLGHLFSLASEYLILFDSSLIFIHYQIPETTVHGAIV